MKLERTSTLALLIGVCAFCAGCGVYTLSSSMASGIETVAVPVFENESVEYGIAEDVTSGVIEGFVADNTLKVVARSRADAILEGTIKTYSREPYTYDENDNVTEYKVNISARVRLNKADGSSVWEEENVAAYGIYDANGESEDDGKARAIAKMTEDMINRTVKDW